VTTNMMVVENLVLNMSRDRSNHGILEHMQEMLKRMIERLADHRIIVDSPCDQKVLIEMMFPIKSTV